MATYIASAKAFVGGRLVRIGDSLEAATDPGFPFVLAAQFKPYEDVVELVPIDPGFAVRDQFGKLVPAAKPTRLVSRSPHELRPFAN